MAGTSNNPKRTRITVRISEDDLQLLLAEAKRRDVTVGAVVRGAIRETLNRPATPTG